MQPDVSSFPLSLSSLSLARQKKKEGDEKKNIARANRNKKRKRSQHFIELKGGAGGEEKRGLDGLSQAANKEKQSLSKNKKGSSSSSRQATGKKFKVSHLSVRGKALWKR